MINTSVFLLSWIFSEFHIADSQGFSGKRKIENSVVIQLLNKKRGDALMKKTCLQRLVLGSWMSPFPTTGTAAEAVLCQCGQRSLLQQF